MIMSMEILTVQEANLVAKRVLEEYSFWIKGEISDIKPDKYYYRYFALKDSQALINCVSVSTKLKELPFPFEEGINVKAFGTLSVYEKRGDFQFKIERIEKEGEGDLQAKIEEIKNRLQKEGLLDSTRKRKLISIPRKIAVITSDDSAAWKDFHKIINARFPLVEIILVNVLVQGEKAAKDIINALTKVNQINDLDLIVITRGGGSLEDLMPFNDEALARAVSESKYPVVSAIGHEKDVSILDLVADLRASTPSNAAELIVPDKGSIFQWLDGEYKKMWKWAESALQLYTLSLMRTTDRSMISDRDKFLLLHKKNLELLSSKILAKKNLYQSLQTEIDATFDKAFKIMLTKIERLEGENELQKGRIENASKIFINKYSQVLEKAEIKLQLNNPLQILEKGYSIVTDKSGKVIKSIRDVNENEILTTKLGDGDIQSSVIKTHVNDTK